MSNDDTQAPTGSPDESATQTTGFSSTDVKEKSAEVSALPPPQSNEVLNSSNLIIHDNSTRDNVDHQPCSFQDHLGKNNSGDNVGDFRPPSESVLAEQEGSKNGEASARYDPHEYTGMSLVGKRFKAVYPERYYVEKNSDENVGELVNGRFKIVKPDAFFSDSDDD